MHIKQKSTYDQLIEINSLMASLEKAHESLDEFIVSIEGNRFRYGQPPIIVSARTIRDELIAKYGEEKFKQACRPE